MLTENQHLSPRCFSVPIIKHKRNIKVLFERTVICSPIKKDCMMHSKETLFILCLNLCSNSYCFINALLIRF